MGSLFRSGGFATCTTQATQAAFTIAVFDMLNSKYDSYTVEFKRSLNKEIKNEICSFVNSSGGKLLVAVDDDGTVCGIMIDNKIRSQLQTPIYLINLISIITSIFVILVSFFIAIIKFHKQRILTDSINTA